jgi:two-component system cell cycle sensor histidine kinase/response regulator CckA
MWYTPCATDAQEELMQRPRVLVVEDEPAIRWLMAEALRRHDLDVLEAEDGKAGVEAAAAADHLDLIISDMKMPRMDGYRMACEIRESAPDIPFIFISGYTRDMHEVPQGEVFLSKPFICDRLLTLVDDAIGRQH